MLLLKNAVDEARDLVDSNEIEAGGGRKQIGGVN